MLTKKPMNKSYTKRERSGSHLDESLRDTIFRSPQGPHIIEPKAKCSNMQSKILACCWLTADTLPELKVELAAVMTPPVTRKVVVPGLDKWPAAAAVTVFTDRSIRELQLSALRASNHLSVTKEQFIIKMKRLFTSES